MEDNQKATQDLEHCVISNIETKPICKIYHDIPYYFCDNCNTMLNMYGVKANYCSHCGKKIKWSC